MLDPIAWFAARNFDVTPGVAIPDEAAWLRMERRDGCVRCSYSTDGLEWNEVPFPMQRWLADHLEVGVIAINTTTAPHVAQFRDFKFRDLSTVLIRRPES